MSTRSRTFNVPHLILGNFITTSGKIVYGDKLNRTFYANACIKSLSKTEI